ncbi:MAG: hypothetical protein ABRQ37_09230, partial [Candidatus Eremiobacterota bacterium]
MEIRKNSSQEKDFAEEIVPKTDDVMKGFSLFNSEDVSEKVSSEDETDDFMKGFSLFNSEDVSEKVSSEDE